MKTISNDCILLVDDRRENLFSLENMLSEENRTFLKAQSGNDALKIAYKEKISLILMDVQMPEMDGFETAELLKMNEKTSKIPVIFVTAINKEIKYILQGLKGGAVDYLFKPLDVDVTRAKVDTMLRLYRQQQELEEKNRQLSILNEEKNRLLGIAAHDLRNPANNILLMSDIVMEAAQDKLDAEYLNFLKMIRQTSEHMLSVVNNVLNVSKIESGNLPVNKKPTNLVALVNKVVTLNSFSARKKDISMAFESQEAAIQRDIDPDLLEQVMNNLINNAIKFSHRDTHINVKVQEIKGSVRIEVKDEGQGIPEEELSRLFKFFSRTSVQGTDGELCTGLGLAISHRIIEAHGGTISVESVPGKGSVFSIVL